LVAATQEMYTQRSDGLHGIKRCSWTPIRRVKVTNEATMMRIMMNQCAIIKDKTRNNNTNPILSPGTNPGVPMKNTVQFIALANTLGVNVF